MSNVCLHVLMIIKNQQYSNVNGATDVGIAMPNDYQSVFYETVEYILNFLRSISEVSEAKYGLVKDGLMEKFSEELRLFLVGGDMKSYNTLFVLVNKSAEDVKLEIELTELSHESSKFVIIKNNEILDYSVPMKDQLSILTLPSRVDIEFFVSIVSNGIYPAFNALIQANLLPCTAESAGLTKGRFEDLTSSFRGLKNSIPIPELRIHPRINEIVKQGATVDNYAQLLGDTTLEDSNFLNELQSMANQWNRTVQNLIRLQQDAPDHSASAEVKYWGNMEVSLAGTADQLQGEQVQISLKILAAAKRLHNPLKFMTDAGIMEALKQVSGYNQFVRTIPLQKLRSSSSLVEVNESMRLLATGFKKFRSSTYPLDKFIIFLQNVSQNVGEKILEVIPNVFKIEYDQFQLLNNEVTNSMYIWDGILHDNNIQIREVIRRTTPKNVTFVSFESFTTELKTLWEKIVTFRQQHALLSDTLKAIAYEDSASDLEFIYEPFITNSKNASYVDDWPKARMIYNQRLSTLEIKFIQIFEHELQNCRSSERMLNIFLGFKPLMSFYPKLRNIMKNNQQTMIDLIIEEIALIDSRLTKEIYVRDVLLLRDLSETAALATQCKQVGNHLNKLVKQLELLLGPEFEILTRETALKKKCDSILSKFNTEKIISELIESISMSDIEALKAPILKMLQGNDGKYQIQVNFDFTVGALFKDTRNLLYMGYKVPGNVVKIARTYRTVYPQAIILLEQIQTLMSLFRELPTRPLTGVLLKTQIDEIWLFLNKALTIAWTSVPSNAIIDENNGKKETALTSLEKNVSIIVNDFEKLGNIENKLSYIMTALSRNNIDTNLISQYIQEMQQVIHSLPIMGFDKQSDFVMLLNRSLKLIIKEKIEWFLDHLALENRTVTVAFEEGSIKFTPNVEKVKSEWLQEIEGMTLSLAYLPQLTYLTPEKNFAFLIRSLRKALTASYSKINQLYEQSVSYTIFWKKYEGLWNLQEGAIEDYIDSDMGKCAKLLTDMLNIRPSLSLFQKKQSFSTILRFEYEEAFSAVFAKYNTWVNYLSNRLMSLYMTNSTIFENELKKERDFLEQSRFDVSSLKNITDLVKTIDKIRERRGSRELLLTTFIKSEKLFQTVHSKLAPDYVFVDQLESDLKALYECSMRKEALLSKNRGEILSKLESEAQRVDGLATYLLESWSKKKPMALEWTPSEALASIKIFEDSCASLESEMELISDSARIMLIPIVMKDHFANFYEELLALKTVWTELEAFWSEVRTLLQMSWAKLNVDSHLKSFERIKCDMNGVPFKTKQYMIFEELFTTIEGVLNSASILRLLKDPSLKTRHWQYLVKNLGKSSVQRLSEISLETVLFIMTKLDEAVVKELVHKARKELVLEESLTQMKSFWNDAQYQTFNHSSGLKLVGEWGSLRQSCIDDLEELHSMKNSVHYKYFESECLGLENKLTKLSVLQSEWMDAQFYWIDLYGILGKNKEMQNLLPLESSKFQGLTSEFKAILSRIFLLNSAIDAVHIPESAMVFKRILNSLKLIKSSLNDLLENKRKLFPKFYFLGNDDLLKLIGAGHDIGRISIYMPKMYGCISGLRSKDDIIQSVISIEQEELRLNSEICITSLRCDEWLALLDNEIQCTIAQDVSKCLSSLNHGEHFKNILDQYAFQVLLLSWQIFWTAAINDCFSRRNFPEVLTRVEQETDEIICEMESRKASSDRRKVKSLLVECLHYVDIVQKLTTTSLPRARLIWFNTQKFFYDGKQDLLKTIHVSLAGRCNSYGFAYIGIPDRLIYTPTLQQGYIALTEALHQKYGGCFFGPAGTGKTETVKSLGQNLGRLVMVFNCDDSYDFHSIARLMLGISQIGSWGCFDEFNRLDENIMSAVSGHVEVVQNGLSDKTKSIDLMGDTIALHEATALFITLNPNYEGRSKLPENLKKKFREFSIKTSDNDIIADVILKILGFKNSKELSRKVVKLFDSLKNKCTNQKHYDFGLRTLKKTLKNCSELIAKSEEKNEEMILVKSLCQTIMPTLVKSDEERFLLCAQEIFSCEKSEGLDDSFVRPLLEICDEDHLCPSVEFRKKCSQFYHIQKNQQALILAGKSGTGKTTVWKTVLKVLKKLEQTDVFVYRIATKTLKKDEIYGSINRASLEWQDGIFTSLVRQVLNDATKTFQKARVWIVFDSDLDPEYAETLNSALDDNKLMTLPTGERLEIPQNLRLIFETDNLDHATPATITRCGLILFMEEVCSQYEFLTTQLSSGFFGLESMSLIPLPVIKRYKAAILEFLCPSTTQLFFEEAEKLGHIMDFEHSRVTSTITALLIHNLQRYSSTLLKASDAAFESFFHCIISQIVKFSFVGDCNWADQLKFHQSTITLFTGPNPSNLDFEDVEFVPETLEAVNLSSLVPQISLEPADVMKPNTIIPTKETIKKELLVFQLLNARKSVILCGPPGSGKTMILNNALQRSSKFDIVGLNFSKETNIAHILKTLSRHTFYVSSSKGLILRPKSTARDIVLFCDEVNLPQPDAYGSQSTILFLRELIEEKGFWKADENKWVTLERIHFVGACNPPTDPGRIPLSLRFTRHVSIMFVGYPTNTSLKGIYSTFYKAALQLTPNLKEYADKFGDASIALYEKFKVEMHISYQTHYIISPRELTRWVRGFYTSLSNSLQHTPQSLLKIWAYEAWRIFADKLICQSEKKRLEVILWEILDDFFPNHRLHRLSPSSLYFSSWLSLDYREVEKQDLLNFIQQRFQTYCEEEIDSSFVIYDEMLSHLLFIDRVLRQIQGHAMLIGPCRTGKTTMTKFVAWLNGIIVVQPCIHKNFTIFDFDEFLRGVLLTCSVEDKKVCLLVDESNILEPSFLERMNTLLANSDVPDLFQETNYENLMSSLKNRILSLGLLIDTEQEMYQWFVQQISKNLHVVFTMRNPYDQTLPSMTTSPALFNRCAINWMGNWTVKIMYQIASFIIRPMPLDFVTQGQMRGGTPTNSNQDDKNVHDTAIDLFLAFDQYYYKNTSDVEASPGTFLDALRSFDMIFESQYQELEDKQRFFTIGLDKLDESVLKVKELTKLLCEKQEQLKVKESEARKTLDKMLHEQNEAERKQEAVVEIKEILATHQQESKQRRKQVIEELEAFIPVLDEAQRGVKNIKKQQLTEIRSMINPPSAVKITMEAVCAVLGQKITSWREIQNFIRKDEFIFDIVNFDTETMLSPGMRSFIEAEYFSMKDFTYKVVNRASKACGPLYQWVYAQLKYGEILNKAEPLKKEVQKIENEALQSNARLLAAEDMIIELEANIEISKQNYSQIIRDIEIIKKETREVQGKLERSKTLISDLTSEKERWARSIQSFKKSNRELTGNCLISALYSNYCGGLVEKQRKQLFVVLKSLLIERCIQFDPNYQFITHNVEIEKRFEWAALGLPNEEFFLENFSMVLTSTIVPYIIDPNSQMISVISKYYGKRFTLSSFLEVGFIKKLENAARFGGVLLIQDAEYFDPIINKLIARELRTSGGRQTVQIGEHEVELTAEFRLLLYSTDADAKLPKFLQSRVRSINFSVNKGSIEMKTMRISLSKEAPEINKESIELMRLNGEYKILLKTLESRLLEELNDSKGNILENDELIQTLERLKLDSSEVENKLRETEHFMTKIDGFSKTYAPLGLHASTLYSILEDIAKVYWFYDFPIWQFMECFESIFDEAVIDSSNRIEQLVWNLYQKVYSLFSSYLLKGHKRAFAVVLYLTHCFTHEDQTFREKAYEILKYIKNHGQGKDIDLSMIDCPTELLRVIHILQNQSSKAALQEFENHFRRQCTLDQLVSRKTGQCILLGTERDVDASFKAVQLADLHQQEISVIALGSPESTHYAEQEILRSSTDGGWILLQNLQMSFLWTKSVLPKMLNQAAGNTTVFMTCNIFGQELPSSLLQQSYKFVYEGTVGILETVKDLYFNTSSRCEWKFLLCWFHSILLNRSLLAPIGFSKKYEFNDRDFACALQFLSDIPVDEDAQGKICFILATIIYGGKVDEEADHMIIHQTCSKIFRGLNTVANSMPSEYEIVEGVKLPHASDHETLSDFLRNLQEPADSQSKWLALPAEAIERYERIQAQEVASQALSIFERDD